MKKLPGKFQLIFAHFCSISMLNILSPVCLSQVELCLWQLDRRHLVSVWLREQSNSILRADTRRVWYAIRRASSCWWKLWKVIKRWMICLSLAAADFLAQYFNNNGFETVLRILENYSGNLVKVLSGEIDNYMYLLSFAFSLIFITFSVSMCYHTKHYNCV